MTFGLDIAAAFAVLAAGTTLLAVRNTKMTATIITTMRPHGPGPRRAS
jgi:hypothetical protein